MGKFDGILIFSDIDGTYIGKEEAHVVRNDEAVRYFTSEGGTFTFSTGRMELNAPMVIPDLRALVNFPAILSNGACFYDFGKDEFLYDSFMEPESVRELISYTSETFAPEIGVRATIRGGFIYPFDHPLLVRDRASSCKPMRELPLSEWELSRIYKVVYRGEYDAILPLKKALEERFSALFEIILSGKRLLEVQKKGVTKGSAIEQVRRWLEGRGTPKRIYCIGDYENDIEMLRAADVAACPANALDEVKAISDVVLCDSGAGAIAELIEYIEKQL